MIAIYCPDVPPVAGGVADHTLVLARALAEQGEPTIILAQRGDPALLAPIPSAMGLGPLDVARAARDHGAGAVILQYVPFLFARRGVSPALVRGVRGIREHGLRLGVILHEPFVPLTRLPWLITGIPQRLQLRAILHQAERVYTGVPRFADIARRYSAASTRVALAPIGATLPVSRLSREEARAALGIPADRVAIGIFSPAASGYAHDWIAAATRALAANARVTWVRFGFGSDRPLPGYPGGDHTIIVGAAAPARLADTMRALDLVLAPYTDGLTLRRSGAMFALASGVPLLSSTGPLFDPALSSLADCESGADRFAARAVLLAGDAEARRALAARTAGYAANASVEALARRIHDDFGAAA